MLRRFGLAAAPALLALFLIAVPAHAQDCLEVLQFKHCVPA